MSAMRPVTATPDAGFDAVVFDCDGVLADTEEAWLLVERELCRSYGVDPEHADRTDTRGVSMHDSVRLLLPQLTRDDDRLDAAHRLIEIATAIVGQRATPLPGVLDLVPSLADEFPIAVASNSPTAVLHPVLTGIGLQHYFEHALGADQVEQPKPAPDLYLLAAHRLGCDPVRVLVVEDSATGVRAARAAGCRVVQVLGTGAQPVDEAHAWLPDLQLTVNAFVAALAAQEN